MKTKIVGYLILAAAVLKVVVDIFNGGGFDLEGNLNSLIAALGGAGLIYLRNGVQKAQDAVTKNK